MNFNTVSFPGLGIGEFTINPTAIEKWGLDIKWYAIIICVGILTAFFVCDCLAKRFDVVSDHVLDVLLISLPAGFIGARVWYILGDLESFDSFMEMIAVWKGGLAIYGGIFAGCLAAFIVCRIKKISALNMLDLASIGFMIGQCIGRWGNFANVEVFGVQTDLPWRMGVGVDCIAEYVHPLFLYESIWNFLGLMFVLAYMDSRKFKGELFLMYTAWYGIGRAWMENLRDGAYNLHLFGVRINLILALVLAIVAIGLIVLVRIKKPGRLMIERTTEEKEQEKPAYEPQFDYAAEPAETEDTEDGQDH